MGEILILRAKYVVGDQDIDVTSYLTTQQSANYGAINFPVQQMDEDLRKKNMIVLEKDADPLKLTPPVLTLVYTDEAGAHHSLTKKLGEVVEIGERSWFGKFVQKPGDVLMDFGLTAAKGQFLFIFVMSWALVVLWSYKQWAFLQDQMDGNRLPLSIEDKFGTLGKYVAIFAEAIFGLSFVIEPPIQKLVERALGPTPFEPGWTVKFFFAFCAALTPVSSFFFNFLIWFTLVQTLVRLN